MKLKQLQVANQKLARNSRGSAVLVEKDMVSYSSDGQKATVEDVTTLIQQASSTSGASLIASVLSTVILGFVLLRCL